MQKTIGMTIVLRLEGLALGLLCVWAYQALGQSWWLFALLFLTPDLSMLGYLASPGIGAAIYNTVHSWVTVAILFFLVRYIFGDDPLLTSLPMILGAHIGFDRALGYGLKYTTSFRDTHLGMIGKDALPAGKKG